MHIHERSIAVRGGSRIGSILLLTAAVCAGSCRSAPSPPPIERPIRIAFGIGPSAKASGVNLLANRLYNEPLIEHDFAGRPGPALADSWHWEPGGRELRIRLKPGVKFHDGTALTAELATEILEGYRNEATPLTGFQRVTAIQPDGELGLRILLSEPDHFLLTALNEVRMVLPDAPEVGTGPYVLESRTPTVQARRFAEYHGGLPGNAEVEIVTYETQRAAWAALMRGEADAAQEISRDAVGFMERSSQIQTYASPQPFYIVLMLNHTRGAMGNPEVRRALSHAMDRQRIVDWAMRGRGIPAAGPIWRLHWAYGTADADSYDPAKAAAMLERAGYPLKQGPADEPGRRLSFQCIFVGEDPQYERIALLVQRQLFDIGVDVELVPLSLKALAERAAAGDFDSILTPANSGRTLVFTHLFWHSPERGAGTLFRTGYSGVDQALDRLRSSTTDEEVRAALGRLGERFRTDAPALFIAWTELTRAVSNRISVGVDPPPDPFMSIWEWRRIPAGATP